MLSERNLTSSCKKRGGAVQENYEMEGCLRSETKTGTRHRLDRVNEENTGKKKQKNLVSAALEARLYAIRALSPLSSLILRSLVVRGSPGRMRARRPPTFATKTDDLLVYARVHLHARLQL